MRSRLSLAVVLAAALSSTGADAQDDIQQAIELNEHLTNSYVVGLAVEQESLRPLKEAGAFAFTGVRTSGETVTGEDAVQFRFRPNASVRRANLAQFVAKVRKQDRRAAADLQRTFASRDVLAEIGTALEPFGMRTDDVADAMAAYLVIAWYGIHGRSGVPSRAELAAVRAQVATAMSGTPEMRTATDAQKQELAEALLIQAVLASQAMDAASGDPSSLAKVGEAINQGAQATFGIDLRRHRLTANGLQVGRTGANGARPHASQPQVTGSNPYALLALVGGAGLGAAFLLGKAAGRRG